MITKASWKAQLPAIFSSVGTQHLEAHTGCLGALFASISHQLHRLGMRLLPLPEEPGVSRWVKWGKFCSLLHVPQQEEPRAGGMTTPSCCWLMQLRTTETPNSTKSNGGVFTIHPDIAYIGGEVETSLHLPSESVNRLLITLFCPQIIFSDNSPPLWRSEKMAVWLRPGYSKPKVGRLSNLCPFSTCENEGAIFLHHLCVVMGVRALGEEPLL